MGKRESVPNRQYTDEFKVEAVRLSESIGGKQGRQAIGHSGFEPVELDQAEPCREAHGRGRCRGAGKAIGGRKWRRRTADYGRELASTKLDLDIVKKAAAYFAKESR